MDYIAYLHKDRDSDFGVSFPDFPGCITAGRTLDEARQMAVEALAFHIAGMVEDEEAIPQPSTLDALAEDPAMKDAVAFLVHMEPATEVTVRINVTAKQKQIELIDQMAAESGMTRSAYMVKSALGNSQPPRSPGRAPIAKKKAGSVKRRSAVKGRTKHAVAPALAG
jgi:predicted RNase H-like HicB family nuclease